MCTQAPVRQAPRGQMFQHHPQPHTHCQSAPAGGCATRRRASVDVLWALRATPASAVRIPAFPLCLSRCIFVSPNCSLMSKWVLGPWEVREHTTNGQRAKRDASGRHHQRVRRPPGLDAISYVLALYLLQGGAEAPDTSPFPLPHFRHRQRGTRAACLAVCVTLTGRWVLHLDKHKQPHGLALTAHCVSAFCRTFTTKTCCTMITFCCKLAPPPIFRSNCHVPRIISFESFFSVDKHDAISVRAPAPAYYL